MCPFPAVFFFFLFFSGAPSWVWPGHPGILPFPCIFWQIYSIKWTSEKLCTPAAATATAPPRPTEDEVRNKVESKLRNGSLQSAASWSDRKNEMWWMEWGRTGANDGGIEIKRPAGIETELNSTNLPTIVFAFILISCRLPIVNVTPMPTEFNVNLCHCLRTEWLRNTVSTWKICFIVRPDALQWFHNKRNDEEKETIFA